MVIFPFQIISKSLCIPRQHLYVIWPKIKFKSIKYFFSSTKHLLIFFISRFLSSQSNWFHSFLGNTILKHTRLLISVSFPEPTRRVLQFLFLSNIPQTTHTSPKKRIHPSPSPMFSFPNITEVMLKLYLEFSFPPFPFSTFNQPHKISLKSIFHIVPFQ